MFCGNNCGGGSLWIIIILVLLFSCGGFGGCGTTCGNTCNNDCGCNPCC